MHEKNNKLKKYKKTTNRKNSYSKQNDYTEELNREHNNRLNQAEVSIN